VEKKHTFCNRRDRFPRKCTVRARIRPEITPSDLKAAPKDEAAKSMKHRDPLVAPLIPLTPAPAGELTAVTAVSPKKYTPIPKPYLGWAAMQLSMPVLPSAMKSIMDSVTCERMQVIAYNPATGVTRLCADSDQIKS